MRAPIVTVCLLIASPAAAQDDAPREERAKESVADDRKLQPEDGLPKPDPEDLRAGHLLISVSGGAFVPSSAFTPDRPGLGSLDAGGAVGLDLGIGLDRYLLLGLDGGYTRLVGADATCLDCRGDSFDVGVSLSLFISQGFAFEPWASYGLGYRRTSLSLGAAEGESFDALELGRLAIGGLYFPTPSFGFGPYAGVDLGFRDFDLPVFYAAFSGGIRLTFDPMRLGTAVRPQVAGR